MRAGGVGGDGAGLARAVRKLSRHGNGGLPALRQPLQKASIRFRTASEIRFRPAGVCLPDSKCPPCILHLERGPSGPITTRARQLPPALVRAPQAGAHAFRPTMFFRLKSPLSRGREAVALAVPCATPNSHRPVQKKFRPLIGNRDRRSN